MNIYYIQLEDINISSLIKINEKKKTLKKYNKILKKIH